MRKRSLSLGAAIILALLALLGRSYPALKSQVVAMQAQGKSDVVARVVDGDTIELGNGQKVRYIGVNTPETVDPRRPVQCFGKEASEENKKLVLGKQVRLEKDVSETDKYGRLLRYVYVETKPQTPMTNDQNQEGSNIAGEIFVNDKLVREGFAYASAFPPDVKFQAQFDQAQEEARVNNRGLWSKCPAK